MRAISSAYDGLVRALAVVAGALIALALVLIVVDVGIRVAGFSPPAFTIAVVEYVLLYFTLFAAPWLVREKGHVYVDALTSRLPAGLRALVEKAAYVICIATTLLFAYYAAVLLLDAAATGLFEDRGIDIPLWLLYAPMPVGFLLVAVEFARYLFGADSMYVDRSKVRDNV